MDLIGLTVAVLEWPIVLVMVSNATLNELINWCLPQYLPNIYQFLAHLPIPLVPWPEGPGATKY